MEPWSLIADGEQTRPQSSHIAAHEQARAQMVPTIAVVAVALGGAFAIYHQIGRVWWHLRMRTDRLQRDQLVATILAGPRYRDRRRLSHFEGQVYSQHGEDGILSEIFRRVGETNRHFVEVGVGDGQENNTVYRLAQGWSGHWFEGDPENIRRIREAFAPELADGRLTVVQALMTAENAASLMQQHGVPDQFDLLSLDIDRNTSHIWRALHHLSPRVVVVEYNASIPHDDEWEIKYDPKATWDGSLHFGASLGTLQVLGSSFGYELVGCDLSGMNAFFVRRELVTDRFVGPFSASEHYEPPRYYLEGRPGYLTRGSLDRVPEQKMLHPKPARQR